MTDDELNEFWASAGCWFAGLPDPGPCDGALRKCHLIPKSFLKNVHRWENDRVDPWDRRVWVYGCGGLHGPGGHHGQYKPDGPRPIARGALPPELEVFAAEFGLSWWLERTYGPLSDELAA